MASNQQFVLTILSGATTSERIPRDALKNARALSVQAPDTLTGTVTVTSGSDDSDSATFTAVQSPPGTDVACAANKTTVLLALPFPTIRLESSLAEGADREFVVCVQVGE